ncbi:helicase SKI2W [Neodiprion fabricii]|uniref:helicase SKI2W n=1 Tax=Neodiprion fabricii TaxID=2872261 RepID=UPI001ED9370F|nr:helicase SKI2W [Neodiprion fabricii]
MSTRVKDFTVNLPFGPPPILSDIKSVLKEYIECPERLPIHDVEKVQCYWPREPDVLALLRHDLAPLGTNLKFDRDPITGRIADLQEVVVKGAGENPRNSMSMSRAPGPPTEGVKGSASNFPFWPGGFDIPELPKDVSSVEINFESDLRTLAKGFKSGIEFAADNCTPKDTGDTPESRTSPAPEPEPEQNSNTEMINLMAMVHEQESLLGLWSSPGVKTRGESADQKQELQNENVLMDLDKVTNLQPERNLPVLKITENTTFTKTCTEWAEVLDVSVPVADFEKRVPDPAFKYPYELDTFQKQAIIKLEENCNVFVAAHTSAGKTTVAEYAIALSQKHMTRAIYTSPIKALSNQKYRDFKQTFDSVGLITGDLQINQTASCLIMTTEILQSMLYCASEVVRDLEYVIFDEVHYINNEDRGHVWEEVLILLPPNVSIVMLSATVPNTLEFADWVGRTKKRKVYVISTLKRPVPLQHYLYTGCGGKSRNDRFLIVDSDGKFKKDGWDKAVAAKASSTKNPGEKKYQLNPNQEKTLWVGFIDHLKRENKLPVVAFTLSRNRCDTNADALRSVDLTTGSEKSHIRVFFQQCIMRLKEPDRELPQIVNMQKLLERGIGVHHSGILPFLKEIVELLFQSGVVKLLFATETFAMGVNMPARTVVFDSVRKFDGTESRTLHPAEYIQMAGRAGRRGLDDTGTVIILCKTEVPDAPVLQNMMLGKPQKLESQFRMTYSMILNLRRVTESVTIEGMMRRSFKEVALIAHEKKHKAELEEVEKQLAESSELTESQKQLGGFYSIATEYLDEWVKLRPLLLGTKKAAKHLNQGRILLISYREHHNKLAVLLATIQRRQDTLYRVLTLTNVQQSNTEDDIKIEVPGSRVEKKEEKSDNWYKIIGFTRKELFIPEGVAGHEVLTISASDILEITKRSIKVDFQLVISDWEKRQIPRFKNDPPGKTCQAAVQELLTISLDAVTNREIIEPFVELKLNESSLAPRVNYLTTLKKKLDSITCTDIANLEEQFEAVFKRKELETRRERLTFQLSHESLSLYPEYTNKVNVLRSLRYIDDDERVALKGRVALEMGTHELLVTELIFKNALTALQPAEIAALLSALVFQQKTNVEPQLISPLKKGCEVMKEVQKSIALMEREHGVDPIEPLNFGLVQVVYEWARSEPFAKIMELTDVQEGIIVRCIQQLNETLRYVKNAAVIIGDPVLKEKMEEASTAIKRDIVFAQSFYTQD